MVDLTVITPPQFLRGDAMPASDLLITLDVTKKRLKAPILATEVSECELPYHHNIQNPSPINARKTTEDIDAFYRHVFTTNHQQKAILIPYERLSMLSDILPDVHINRYESVDDFWGWHWKTDTITQREQYDIIIDMCKDEKVWARKEPLSFKEKGRKKGRHISADCLIFAQPGTVEEFLVRQLAANMWKGSIGMPGFWELPGKRHHRPCVNLQILLSEFEPVSYRLPLFEKSNMGNLTTYAERVKQVLEYIKRCGWYSGAPQIFILACPQDGSSRNVPVDPGSEHLFVLPVEEDQVIEWMDDGSVVSGKVILVDVKGNKYGTLKDGFHFRRRKYNNEELFESGAEIVVMYCDHGHSRSPEQTEYHLKWLREKHPESTQRVLMMRQGMWGLKTRIRDLDRIDDFFEKRR